MQRLHLRHAAATLVEVLEGRLHGRLGRERDGTWWGDALAFGERRPDGDPIKAMSVSAEPARFEVHTTVRADGPWLTPFAATAGVGGLMISGRRKSH